MYDNPTTISYQIGGLHDVAAGNMAQGIKGPPGATGLLRHIGLECTEVFNEVTTAAFFRIGSTGDADLYAEYDIGTLAATDFGVAPESAFKLRALPADTQIEVTTLQNTGGTPTGIGRFTVVIDWNHAQPDPTP